MVMTRELWIRAVFAYLALQSALIGVWALMAPRSFYDDFPGAGRAWVAVDGPYNEHLVRDVGALNLAILVVFALAAFRPSRDLIRLAAGVTRFNFWSFIYASFICIGILAGMNSLLSRWGCQVWTARSREECATLLDSEMRPQLALIDYHLDDGETGTQLMAWLRTRLGEPVPGVVISADARPELVAEIHAAGLDYLSKPVKPAALRALLSRHLSLR